LHEKPELVAGWSNRGQIETNNAMLRNVAEPIAHTAPSDRPFVSARFPVLTRVTERNRFGSCADKLLAETEPVNRLIRKDVKAYQFYRAPPELVPAVARSIWRTIVKFSEEGDSLTLHFALASESSVPFPAPGSDFASWYCGRLEQWLGGQKEPLDNARPMTPKHPLRESQPRGTAFRSHAQRSVAADLVVFVPRLKPFERCARHQHIHVGISPTDDLHSDRQTV
jgi:hypothetical protein